MGKTYSTQLKICNDTTSTITMTVSRVKKGDFLGHQTPENNFHQVKISPDSEYSREQVVNLRRPAHVFSLKMRFQKDKADTFKELLFRMDQGRPAAGKRNQCLPHKEKNIFEFVGDEHAFDVKDTISGNTLTIRIKDSYMYQFGDKEEMKIKAQAIAEEQKKAAQVAVEKAEADKRAKEEAKRKQDQMRISDFSPTNNEDEEESSGDEEEDESCESKERREDKKKETEMLMAEVLRLADEERQERLRGEEERVRNNVNLSEHGQNSKGAPDIFGHSVNDNYIDSEIEVGDDIEDCGSNDAD